MRELGIVLATFGPIALLAFFIVSLWTHTFVVVAFLGILLAISVGFNLITMSDS